MFCENCGKSLIRGYQFCLECGTPVPPEAPEENSATEAAAEAADESMPGIQPITSEEGKLVFCQNCGMRMQKTTAFCEQCGMQLQSNQNSGSGYSNLPSNNGVPLWNTERIDYGYENISDGEIQQINNFMNGGGIADPDQYNQQPQTESENFGGGMDAIGGFNAGGGIDTLNSQYANLCKSDNDNSMPALNAQSGMIRDDIQKVESFAMDPSYVDDTYVDEGALPIIEGGSMDFDPDEPEPEDPNAFEMIPDPVPAYVPTAEPTSYFTDNSAAEAAPVYEESAAEEAPVYEEPVAEEVPVYEEPAAEEVPVYEEPVAEVVPAYTIPVYSDDEGGAVEASVYSGEQQSYSADIPLYSDPNEPAVPVYEEPAAEAAPVYEEPAVEEAPVYSEPASEEPDGIMGAAFGVTAAMAAADDDTAVMSHSSNDVETIFAAPVPEYNPAPSYSTPADDYNTVPTGDETVFAGNIQQPENSAVDLGKLVYCRNCGQDMYERAEKCDLCGHKNIWWGSDAIKPLPKHRVSEGTPEKKPINKVIPAIAIAAVAILVFGFLLGPSIFKEKEDIVDKPTTSDTDNGIGDNDKADTTTSAATTTTTTASEAVTEPEEDNNQAAVTTTTTATSDDKQDDKDNKESVEESGEKDDEPTEESTTAATTTTRVTTTRATTTTTRATTTTTTTTRATTTTTKAATTTPAPYYAPSATVKAQNKERDAIISAYETMSAEIGKLELLASSTVNAMMFDDRSADAAGKSFYSRDFAVNMIKQIKSGKSSVDSAVASAKPSTSELNSAYTTLKSLQTKYNAYYDYVVNATSFSKYESKCASYYSDYTTTAKSGLGLAKLNTNAQTTTDRDEYYADVLSEALVAVDNAASALSTMRTKLSALNDSTFSTKYTDVLNSNITTYLKAAKYAQAVASYCDILSAAPSKYSSAYSQLKTARDNLNNCMDLFTMAQYDNTLSNFKSTSNNYINAASNASANAKYYM